MSNMIIRKMTENDIDEVMEISKNSFSSPWSKNTFISEVSNENTLYIVATLDNIIVGYCGVDYLYDEVHIMNIAVTKEYRGRGIAKELLNEIFKYCRKENFFDFTLEVRRSNIEAINLYKAMGFTKEGIRRAYYEDTKEDAIIMWKFDTEELK